MYICVSMYIQREWGRERASEIGFIAHIMMETNWRPRRAKGVQFQSKFKDLRTRNADADGVSSNFKSSNLETQEEPLFQFESKSLKTLMPQLSHSSRKNSLLFSIFVLTRSLISEMSPIHVREGNQIYSVYLFKCSSHLKTPSQAHPE